MATEYSNVLSVESAHDILDDKGNLLKVSVINRKLLFLRTVVVEGNTVHMTSPIDGLCIRVEDSMRLIMQIADIVQFSGVLNEKETELLRAIEIIAQYGISQ